MGIALTGFPPPQDVGEYIYNNQEHLLRTDVADVLAHDQRLYARHLSKVYTGIVFATLTDNGVVVWCEAVASLGERSLTHVSADLPALITFVINRYGYA